MKKKKQNKIVMIIRKKKKNRNKKKEKGGEKEENEEKKTRLLSNHPGEESPPGTLAGRAEYLSLPASPRQSSGGALCHFRRRRLRAPLPGRKARDVNFPACVLRERSGFKNRWMYVRKRTGFRSWWMYVKKNVRSLRICGCM